MSEQTLRVLGVALATAGVAVTSYLLYERWTGGPLLCTTGGCDVAQSSRFAKVLGVPVALLGLLAYLALGVLFVLRGAVAQAATIAVGVGAVAFSSYLLVVQIAVIDAICEWCVVSDVLVTAVAALALLRAYAAVR